MKIVYGYQNTKYNGEDLALTPYLFLVKLNEKHLKCFGIGICFLNFSYHISIGSGFPDNWKHLFRDSNNKNKQDYEKKQKQRIKTP